MNKAGIVPISDRVALILNELKLPQKTFASELGVSRNYINLVMNGKKASLSESLMKLIEKIFGYSAKWIKGGGGKKIVSAPVFQAERTIHHTAKYNELIKMIEKLPPMGFEHVFSFTKQILLYEPVPKSHDQRMKC